MGLGPSIKMTSLHHFNCPATKLLLRDAAVECGGVIVSGISESYDDKIASAIAAGEMAANLEPDGALVAIDGWGNHHIDFVSVIEQLGQRGIPVVGLSFIGRQGRLVCTNEYVKTIIDTNKTASGYESCTVGQNCMTDFDCYKALGLLKARMPRTVSHTAAVTPCEVTRKYLPVADIRLTDSAAPASYAAASRTLALNAAAAQQKAARFSRLKRITVSVLRPSQRSLFVNSNLDYMPIAKKESGALGEGVTEVMDGVTVMLTGVEDVSGYQPANIGSSEGTLAHAVEFDTPATPKSSDVILHIDVLFNEGEGRTAAGVAEAHAAADLILDDIRAAFPAADSGAYTRTERFANAPRAGRPRVVLVKLVSGLGNMYDTALFPAQPAGCIGSQLIRLRRNLPVLLTPTQVLDGAIHSLI